MLQDPNVIRYVQQQMRPVVKQLRKATKEIELLKSALTEAGIKMPPKKTQRKKK